MVHIAPCPYCHEKLAWGETETERRPLPERCMRCFEPLSLEDRAILELRADVAIAGHSFNLPAE